MENYRDISLAKCKSHPFQKPAPKEYEVFSMEDILRPPGLSDFIKWVELMKESHCPTIDEADQNIKRVEERNALTKELLGKTFYVGEKK